MSPVVKKKGEKYHLPSKYLLLILTGVCIALMLITLTTNLFVTPLNSAFGYVITPFQKGASRLGSYISSRAEELIQIKELLEENKELHAQVDELTLENTKLQQDRYELYSLRELYAIDDQYSDYDKIGARVIAKDAGNWFSSFLIDKGSNDGLEINMNVIANGGLVGYISNIGPDWARVTTIIEDHINVSGMVLSTSDILVVSGSLELMEDNMISFSQLVDKENKVEIGDKIVTSNISDKYLPGILIGYITQVNTDANNLSRSGYLSPAVDFEHLEIVLVILEQKQVAKE